MVRAVRSLVVPGLAAIASRYDAILLDQFGVLHDGKNAIDGAVACYDALAAAGKKLVVLSNTSRRRATALKKLPSLGFSADALAGFVCSGEEAYAHMAEQRAGQRFCWWSWEDDYLGLQNADYCDGLGLTLAPPEEADFVLCQGSQRWRAGDEDVGVDLIKSGSTAGAVDDALRRCAARGLEMICANPDYSVVLPDGSTGYMPGNIARRYEELGGAVTYYGKPHPPAFAACRRLLGDGVPPERVLHVGDSMAHDVAGANRAGIDSLFIAAGIHAAELGLDDGDNNAQLDDARLAALFEAYGAEPTHVAARFEW